MSDQESSAGSADRAVRAGPVTAEHGGSTGDRAEGLWQDGLTMLITSHDQRSVLPRALRSAFDALDLLDAAGLPTEIVVIDDASVDGAQRLLRSVQALYDEPRLRILCLREGVGPAALLDLGLRASAFRHVCVMNADNELVPANLPLFAQSASDTGAAMVYGNVIEKKRGEIAGVRSNMPVIPGLGKSRRLDSFFILDAERLSSLEEVAETNAKGPEGWKLALRLLAEGQLAVFVPALLGYFHKRTVSTGGKPSSPGMARTSPRRVRLHTDAGERNGVHIGRIYHPEVGFID